MDDDEVLTAIFEDTGPILEINSYVPTNTFFIALAGQTTDYILLSGGVGTDGILQAGH